jgi:predicted NBD/HSP70 family sugar kinase
MDKSKMLIMGVDIGGKGIKTGMVNSNGEILCQDSFDPNGLSGDEIVNKIGEIALKYKNSGGGVSLRNRDWCCRFN